MNTYYYSETNVEKLKVLNEPFRNELTSESPRVEMSNPYLKIPLRAHQAACVKAMLDRETDFTNGKDISGEKVFSSWSILGDGVGVGKSFTVLSHIAFLKQKESIQKEMPTISMPCSSYMYSLKTGYDVSECNASIIVVPHTLFKQWSNYIKEQASMKTLFVTTRKILESRTFVQDVFASDVVLISNTLYGLFAYKMEHVQFKRVYIDEADSIHITGSNPLARSKFLWLISASYPNLLFPQVNFWISTNVFHLHMFGERTIFHSDFVEQFRSFYNANRHNNYSYYTNRHHIVSMPFLRKLLLPNHPQRGQLVIRSSLHFIKESIQLPQLFRQTIVCRSPMSYQVISNVIGSEVRNYLHAGDIQSALQSLGVAEDSQTNLIEAVTENRKKELERIRKTYEFKSSLEYSTPQAKEQALANLKQKMEHLEEQIKSISERLENFQKEACPICFDEPVEPLLTNCCERIFCASCILTSLTRNLDCPMCRHRTNPSSLRKISAKEAEKKEKKEEPDQPPLKREALLRLFQQYPKGKFLIFSRYDNPFTQIAQELETNKITVQEVKGNKDVIAATLNRFQNGETRCLLLNSIHAGAGLTITAATHVILLHAMNLEEEKQIIGRAYRLGRKEPLTIFKLVHPDELETNN